MSHHDTRTPITAKLGLGTVQFGAPYGHHVRTHKVSQNEVFRIAEAALEHKLKIIDTASAYGDAELVVGKTFPGPFQIVTKLPPKPSSIGENEARNWVRRTLNASLRRLGRNHLYGVLVHNPDDLAGDIGKLIVRELRAQQEADRIGRIGVSVYAPEDLDRTSTVLKPSIVQCPYNYLDRRIEDSGWADRLKAQGCEIHTRSVFLQGVLLLPPQRRSPELQQFSSWLSAFDREAVKFGGDRVVAALGGAIMAPWCDAVICGVANTEQLMGLIQGVTTVTQGFQSIPTTSAPDKLIDPRLWC